MRLAIRVLMVVCGLLLVPPPCWCCLVLTEVAPAAAVEKLPVSSKKSCCHRGGPAPQTQLPKERPCPTPKFCCFTPDSLQPDPSAKFAPDAAAAPVVIPPLANISG